jgi:23S rRNA pseudouridine1911/1915/1917 synthase
MQIIATEDQHRERLDVVVAVAMPQLSRAFVQKLCNDSKVLVQGESVKPGYKVKEGDLITVDYDPAELKKIPDIDRSILYEDNDCIVINKPAGVLTHAQGAHIVEATVATFLRSKLAKDLQEGANAAAGRAGIVHRLDRATSGVIIGAKHTAALSALQKQFAQRKVKKAYIAIVAGHLKQPEAVIYMPIERNPKAPATFRVGPNGKHAITHYTVLQESKTASLIELHPETGRTHQLRVHLAQIGHPIIGDPLYGTGAYGDRLYLHALSLEITVPANRERKVFKAPLPREFKEFMAL